MPLSHTWTIYAAQVVVNLGTPKTALQYVANANYPAEILGFRATQRSTTTSGMEEIRLGKISAAATGLVAGAVGTNIFRWGSADDTFRGQLGTALTGTGVGVTPVEPTYSDVPVELDFNVLNGYEGGCPYGPLYVPPGGIVGLRMFGNVAATWNVALLVHENA